MAKTLRDILDSRYKSGDLVTIITVTVSGNGTTFSGKIVGLGDDYVTVKREGYEECFIALRHVVAVS